MSVRWWDFTGVDQIRVLRNGREITRPISIETDDDSDSMLVLQRDIPELQRWQVHPTELGFWVEEFQANRIAATNIWEGSVRWSDTLQKNPTDEPPRLQNIRSEMIESATFIDFEGKPILNTAGDMVEPLPKREQILVFVFQKKVPGLIRALFQFEDAINSDNVQILGDNYEPFTLLFRKVDFSDEQEADDVKFRTLNIELAHRASGWRAVFPSRGFNELATYITRAPNGKLLLGTKEQNLEAIMLKDNTRPTEPQFLDADGAWIKDPAANPDKIVLLKAKVQNEISFGPILNYIAQ